MFNIVNKFSLKWNKIIDYMSMYGYDMKKISPKRWLVECLSKVTKNDAIYPLLSIYAGDGGIHWAKEQNQFCKAVIDNTNIILRHLKLNHIQINYKIIKCYFTFLDKGGFMPKTTSLNNVFSDIKNVVPHMPGNFYWKDKDGVYLGCSKSLLDLLKLKNKHDFVGKTDYDLWPEQADGLRLNDYQVMNSDIQINFEEYVEINNNKMFFTVIKMPLKDGYGNIIGIIGNSLDITYRKKLDNEKIAAEYRIQNERINNYLKEISQCMPGNFYWKDTDGKYIGCNKAVLKMMGYKDEMEIIGKTDYDLWPEQADEIRKHDAMVMRSDNPIDLEETVTMKNHDPMYFAVIKMPMKDAAGNLIGIIGNSLDITYQKETARPLLETATQKIQIAEHEKFRKTAEQIAHDIRSPLMSLNSVLAGIAKRWKKVIETG